MKTKNLRRFIWSNRALQLVVIGSLFFYCAVVTASGEKPTTPTTIHPLGAQKEKRGITLVASPNPENNARFSPRYHALLVGVPNYANDAINTNLAASINDFAALLSEQYGFQTTLLQGPDATLAQLDQALLTFIETLTEDDCLLLYVACASEADLLLDDTYWMTAPERKGVDLEAMRAIGKHVSSHRFLNWIKSIQARHILLLTDTFFTWNRRRGESFMDAETGDDATAWYQKTLSRPSRLVLQRNPHPQDRNPWLLQRFHHLLSNNSEPFLAVSELLPKLRTSAHSDALQNGRLSDARDSGGGAFVFQLSDSPTLPIASLQPTDPIARKNHESGMAKTPDTLKSNRAVADFSFDGTLVNGLGTLTKLEIQNVGYVFPSIVEQGVTTNAPIRVALENPPELLEACPLSEGLCTAFWLQRHEASAPMCFKIEVNDNTSVTFRTDPSGYLLTDIRADDAESIWFLPTKLDADRWYHVVVNVEAGKVTGFLNQKAVAFEQTDAVADPSENTGEFELDELKVFRGKLSEDDVSELYMMKYQRFALTKAWAKEIDDLDEICRVEYGERASMTDWNTLEHLFAGEIVDFMDAIGWEYHLGVLLRCGGKRYWKDNRHYSATRYNGFTPDFHLTHETIDEHQLDLGSWFQMQCPILVQRY